MINFYDLVIELIPLILIFIIFALVLKFFTLFIETLNDVDKNICEDNLLKQYCAKANAKNFRNELFIVDGVIMKKDEFKEFVEGMEKEEFVEGMG